MLYCAVRGEVDTSLLLAEAWASGKRVLLPAAAPTSAASWTPWLAPGPAALVRSGLGIPEPTGKAAPPELTREALIVTPAWPSIAKDIAWATVEDIMIACSKRAGASLWGWSSPSTCSTASPVRRGIVP